MGLKARREVIPRNTMEASPRETTNKKSSGSSDGAAIYLFRGSNKSASIAILYQGNNTDFALHNSCLKFS